MGADSGAYTTVINLGAVRADDRGALRMPVQDAPSPLRAEQSAIPRGARGEHRRPDTESLAAAISYGVYRRAARGHSD